MDQGDIRSHVLELMKEKDKIESEIRDLTTILNQNGIGMQDSLVDSEGFPLNSIDIYQVRHARHKIICLQNDHKALMKKIELGLQGYYSASSAANGMDTQPLERAPIVYEQPFAKVTIVSDNSPAYYAGILVDDQVVEFGTINYTNFRNITDIAAVVQHSENSECGLVLLRNGRRVTVKLIPKKWNGRGLLGCNIISL